MYDADLIWRPKKSQHMFNSQGFIGPVVDEAKRDGEYRIFTLGDSNTAGHPGWPVYLGKLFEAADANVEVVNAGVWGYSSWQGLNLFKEILRYQPDMVLVSFGGNDAHRVTIPDSQYVRSRRFYSESWILKLRISQLIIAANDIILLKNKRSAILVPRVSLDEYERNLGEMIRLAKEHNVRLVFLTRPFTGTSYHELWWKNFAPAYNEITLRVADEQGVNAIDIYAYFKNADGFFADESHFTTDGHFMAARIIYEQIKDRLR